VVLVIDMKKMLIAAFLLLSSVAWAGGPDVGYPSAEDINTAVSSITTALAAKPSSPVSIANGGTGQTASSAALAALGGYSLAVAYQTAAATYPDSINAIASFDTEVVDFENAYNPATSKYTAAKTGFYEVTFRAVTGTISWSATDILEWYVAVNGNQKAILESKVVDSTTSKKINVSGSAIVFATAGQEISVMCGSVHSGGIPMTVGEVQCRVSFKRVY